MLFTFPSRYWFTIGHQVVFSLGGWAPQIPTGFHVSRRTWEFERKALEFRVRGSHPLWPGFPSSSTSPTLCNFLGLCTSPSSIPQPRPGNACRLHTGRFGLFPVRSPLLRESRLISTPAGTEMFQFPAFASYDDGCLGHRVAPFGNLRIIRSRTAPRSLSQFATSFVAS